MQLKTTKTKNNGIDGFMVEFPPVNGKRQRQFFKARPETKRAKGHRTGINIPSPRAGRASTKNVPARVHR